MPRTYVTLGSALLMALLAFPAGAGEPDYHAWNRLLSEYLSAPGFDYAGLQRNEKATLQKLRREMAAVDVSSLTKTEELAYWINLYNINVVGLVVDNYPIDSIRDLSTDFLVRLNVFKKDHVPFGTGKVSLDFIEHERVRPRFRDGRIHFAVNCGAVSCPPVRDEAYLGARIDEQLDDQVRRFAAGPGIRVESGRGRTTLHTTKIMDWYGEDFEKWHGGIVRFLLPYLPESKRSQLEDGERVRIEFDNYDWSLNDWKR